jgi:fumarate hydratase class I
MIDLTLPLSETSVRGLHVGDPVSLHGVMVTGRDAAHKWLVETFVRKTQTPKVEDLAALEGLRPLLRGGAIYHCGPVVAGLEAKAYRFVAAGPTTSTREEPYQAEVLQHFGVRAVIGKGGMLGKTLEGCRKHGAAYLHAIGGAATLIAESCIEVLGVYKLDFGVPEAFWEIRVEDFPCVVTMDSHGQSLHEKIEADSKKMLAELLAK